MLKADYTRFRRNEILAQSAAWPFVRMITRIRTAERPTYLLTPNGLEKISDGLSDREHEMIRQCEDWIEQIYRDFRADAVASLPQHEQPSPHA